MIPCPAADIRVTLHDLKPHITTYKTAGAVNQRRQKHKCKFKQYVAPALMSSLT